MLFKPNAPRPPWFAGLLMFIAALLPLWEACAVAFKGSMAPAHCNGAFAGALCNVGLLLGRAVLGTGGAHIGYVAVSGGLGALLPYMAWGLDRRFRAKDRA